MQHTFNFTLEKMICLKKTQYLHKCWSFWLIFWNKENEIFIFF